MSDSADMPLQPDPVPNRDIAYLERPLAELPDSFQTVYAYWHLLRGRRFAPTWQEFDMMQIPPALLPSTLVKDVERDPLAFRYRFYGTHFARLWDRDLTGKTTDDIASPLLAQVIRQTLTHFIAQKQPAFYLLHIGPRLNDHRLQVQLRLPISNDGETVTNIVSLVSHQIDMDAYSKLFTDG
ncbi:MAG: PAS domain-containing protein [Rhodospirillales bacterium]|nr:PAS domain-containing protein [Rhodospirillales bacterium]